MRRLTSQIVKLLKEVFSGAGLLETDSLDTHGSNADSGEETPLNLVKSEFWLERKMKIFKL